MVLLAMGIAIVAPLTAQGPIANKRAQVAVLERQLAAIDARAGEAAAAHNLALDRRDAVTERLRSTRIAQAEAGRALAGTRRALTRRVLHAYAQGTPDPIDVVLQSGSLSDAFAGVAALELAAQADARLVDRVRAHRAELAALRVRLAADARLAAAALAEADSQRRRLGALLGERRAALAAARDELGDLLAAERTRLARLAAAKRATLTAAPAAGTGSSAPTVQSLPGGSHVFPLAGPSRFSDDWLASRPGGRYHEGIDLFAERGTPVLAVADGVLYRIGYSGISGYRLWLRDAAGTAFFYAHLDGYAPAAREGASVTKGTVLGYNGDTGDAAGTSPHVHFEIHPGGGGPIRPYPIVSAWPRAA